MFLLIYSLKNGSLKDIVSPSTSMKSLAINAFLILCTLAEFSWRYSFSTSLRESPVLMPFYRWVLEFLEICSKGQSFISPDMLSCFETVRVCQDGCQLGYRYLIQLYVSKYPLAPYNGTLVISSCSR